MPPNPSIEVYPPKIGTETGQGSIINSKPTPNINPKIKPPLKELLMRLFCQKSNNTDPSV